MQNFSYWNPTRIIFGKGTISEVGKETAKWGKKVLFHFGGGSIKANGVFDAVTASLKDAGLQIVYLGGVVPNPRLSLVREGIALCKKEHIDFVLAVGGGSVIDSAKAIAFGAKLPPSEDVWNDYYMKASYDIREALPLGVVLTIPAAGSESSTGSVISDAEHGLKRAVNSETLISKFAVMDPQTNYSLPAYQTACGASDILAHLQERYFTTVEHNDLSDRLLEACMRNVITNAPLALQFPNEYRYRAELMWTGTIAHNNLLDRGEGRRLGDSRHRARAECLVRYRPWCGPCDSFSCMDAVCSQGRYRSIHAVCDACLECRSTIERQGRHSRGRHPAVAGFLQTYRHADNAVRCKYP